MCVCVCVCVLYCHRDDWREEEANSSCLLACRRNEGDELIRVTVAMYLEPLSINGKEKERERKNNGQPKIIGSAQNRPIIWLPVWRQNLSSPSHLILHSFPILVNQNL